MIFKGICLSVAMLAAVCLSVPAMGYPLLQIYLEGGTYDSQTESWYLEPPGSSAGEPLRLWIIGDTSTYGTIYDVKLSMAYTAEEPTTTKGTS